ncbi:conserved hypothetical protein [Oenococcus oeni]|uniref:type II toxin-antitoxin system RelE/ParE family toxin n=1 Tax=Oenococcus oeni TaxID=1247 RepID=UPI0010BBD1E4|nr:type II toxin-antitoxin system RelE/ParE family toxin [Oenococcus oeni]SYW03269.1 conserved hypothetical protein [Oenococcus oeni]
MLNFIFPASFNKKWRSLDLNDSDKEDLKYLIANYVKNAPLNNKGQKFPGDLIRKTAGAIKYRYAPSNTNQGKSGSYRIIYFIYSEDGQNVYFLDIYPKNVKENLTDEEENKIKVFIKKFKKELRKRRK